MIQIFGFYELSGLVNKSERFAELTASQEKAPHLVYSVNRRRGNGRAQKPAADTQILYHPGKDLINVAITSDG